MSNPNPCRKCGCERTPLINSTPWFRDQVREVHECHNCGYRFTTMVKAVKSNQGPKKPALNRGTACECCGGRTLVTSTLKDYRKRKCKSCGHCQKQARVAI